MLCLMGAPSSSAAVLQGGLIEHVPRQSTVKATSRRSSVNASRSAVV